MPIELPIIELDELVELFQYTNRRALVRAIRLKRFPIKTFDVGGRLVAHAGAVDQYFDHMKAESLKELNASWDK